MALKNLISVGPMSLEYAVVEKGLPKAVSNRALQVKGRLKQRRGGAAVVRLAGRQCCRARKAAARRHVRKFVGAAWCSRATSCSHQC